MYQIARADAVRLPLPDQSVDLILGSPPYIDARTYGIGATRKTAEWIDWMLTVTAEAVRVSRGLVVWVCAAGVRKHCYQPACEGLLYRWWAQGSLCWRPAYWHRVGIPGSGGKHWLRGDIEYVLAFVGPDRTPHTNPLAIGKPPKYAPGGEMSYRLTDGTRRNQWGGTATAGTHRKSDGSRETPGRPSHVYGWNESGAGNRDTNGQRKARSSGHLKRMQRTVRNGEDGKDEQFYQAPVIANPGNLFHTKAGGGHMGNTLAHENEAPYPEALIANLIRIASHEGDIVLDPFGGSGTTAAVCQKWGRHALTFDLRQSQCALSRRRIESDRPSLFDSLA